MSEKDDKIIARTIKQHEVIRLSEPRIAPLEESKWDEDARKLIEGFKEISRSLLIEPTKKQLPRGVTWSHPAFANRHVFVRNDEKLIRADLSQ